MERPRFLYFDMGNVLLTFSNDRMCRQLGAVAGVAPERVRQILFDEDLQRQYELGRATPDDFYGAFCRGVGGQPDCGAVHRAGADMFELNLAIVPVVAGLRRAGHRLGVLSNTCEGHWEHCRRRFALLDDLFEVHALSYRIGAMKPDPAIYRAAAEMAGWAPETIFFTDDVAGHVAGARAAGLDGVQYIGVPQLVAELRARGLPFNY